MKTCSRCGQNKTTNDFYKLKSSKDGFDYHCKVCEKSRKSAEQKRIENAKYHASHKEVIKERKSVYRQENREKIQEAQKQYNRDNADKLKENKKVYRELNKDKIAEANRQYYQQNKSVILQNARIYNETHKEEIRSQRKEYRKRNEEKIKQAQVAYNPIRNQRIKERLQTDEMFRVSSTLRTKLSKVMKGSTTSFVQLLGLERDLFIAWIEFQFEPWMNWNNYATEWQLDHVLPISVFNPLKDIDKRVCFRWMNIQPLCSKENRSKSNKVDQFHFLNSFISAYNFIKHVGLDINEYQALIERLRWLRNHLRYGKNLMDETMENPHPSP